MNARGQMIQLIWWLSGQPYRWWMRQHMCQHNQYLPTRINRRQTTSWTGSAGHVEQVINAGKLNIRRGSWHWWIILEGIILLVFFFYRCWSGETAFFFSNTFIINIVHQLADGRSRGRRCPTVTRDIFGKWLILEVDVIICIFWYDFPSQILFLFGLLSSQT